MRLRYWITSALQTSLCIFAGSMVYGVMMSLMGSGESVQDLLQMSSLYLLLFGASMGIIISTGLYKLNLALALSFGSSRKEAFLGMQCYRMVFLAVILAGSVALSALAGEHGLVPVHIFATIAVTVLLAAGAMGSIVGILSTRFGKNAMIAIGILCGLLLSAGIAGVVIFLVVLDAAFNLSGWGFVLFPALGLLVHGLSLIPEYKTIYKYNVKL